MTIDPRNPVFRYIDKLLLAAAIIIAVVAILNTLGKSPAEDVLQRTQATLTQFEQEVAGRQAPDYTTPETYRLLMGRFDPDSVPKGVPLRDHVFFPPWEIIGRVSRLTFNPNIDESDQRPDVYSLDEFKFSVRRIVAIEQKPRDIASIDVDEDRNALVIKPRREGNVRANVTFNDGSSLDFQIISEERTLVPEPDPEAPVNIAAVAVQGRVTLTFSTNPSGAPVTTYTIYRSQNAEEQGSAVGKIQTNKREIPETAANRTGPVETDQPKVVVRRYTFDDLSVSPQKTYFYRVEATGTVIRDEQSREVSNISNPVEIVSGDNFELTLTSGVNDIANVEILTWRGFVPEFRTVSVRPGERVGETGFNAVIVEDTMVEDEAVRPVWEEQEDGSRQLFRRSVRFLRPDSRLVVSDASGRVIELFRGQPMRPRYAAEVQALVEKYAKASPASFPAIDAPMDIGDRRARPELVLTNESSQEALFILDARNPVKVVLPGNTTRTLQVDRGEYKLLWVYPAAKAADIPVVFGRAESLNLNLNERYHIRNRAVVQATKTDAAPAVGAVNR